MVIDPTDLENWVAEILSAHGTEATRARRVASALVDADAAVTAPTVSVSCPTTST